MVKFLSGLTRSCRPAFFFAFALVAPHLVATVLMQSGWP